MRGCADGVLPEYTAPWGSPGVGSGRVGSVWLRSAERDAHTGMHRGVQLADRSAGRRFERAARWLAGYYWKRRGMRGREKEERGEYRGMHVW